MSGEDKTVVRPVEIPGMQIKFESPVGALGKTLSVITVADADEDLEALNKRLDVIASAVRRQEAFEMLRYDQQAVLSKRKEIAKNKAKIVATNHTIQSKIANFPGSGRRGVDATKAAPQEISTIAQTEGLIAEAEAIILLCEERIPFWKAVLRGEEPLNLDDDGPSKMAAE
jgi:hypothetical protein